MNWNKQIHSFELKWKHYLAIGGVWILVLLSLIGLKSCQNKRDDAIANTSLAEGVKEKIIINPLARTVTVITAKGSKTTTLSDHASSVEIFQNGNVKTTLPQHGFEAVPFAGIGYSSQLNDYIGIDFYYWKRLDIGTAFSFDRDLKVRSLGFPVVVSFAVYHNIRLSLGVEPFGPSHAIHGLVSVRL